MTDHTTPEQLAAATDALADEQALIHLCSWVEIRNLLRANAAMIRTLSAQHAAAVEIAAQYAAERDSLRAELEGLKAQGQWLPIEDATEDDDKGGPAWLLVDGVVVRGYFISIPFQEYRDADGFYLGQQDAEAYWARAEDGEPVSPTHFQRIRPPAPPTGDESAAIDSARAGRVG